MAKNQRTIVKFNLSGTTFDREVQINDEKMMLSSKVLSEKILEFIKKKHKIKFVTMLEPSNQFDSKAIAILVINKTENFVANIGYVPTVVKRNLPEELNVLNNCKEGIVVDATKFEKGPTYDKYESAIIIRSVESDYENGEVSSNYYITMCYKVPTKFKVTYNDVTTSRYSLSLFPGN